MMCVVVSFSLLALLGFVQSSPVLRISNGENATSIQYPYQVSIQSGIILSFKHKCGGAIISPSWIITAAHCLNVDILIGRIVAGVTDLTNENDKNVQIRHLDMFHIVIHPNFTDNNVNDIALVKMTEPFRFNEYVQPIKISKVPCVANEHVTFTGFGITEIDQNTAIPSETLQVTKLIPIGYEECHGLLEPLYGTNMNYNSDTHVCAIGSSGPCVLDDGGPLIQDDRLIGVLSWLPAPCGTETIPTVFTRIGYYVDFIEKHVDDLPSSFWAEIEEEKEQEQR